MILRETFPAGPFQCNCTILACGDTKDAVIIDPGGEVEKIRQIVEHYHLNVTSVIHTHAHLDHIYCTREVKENHGGEICLHADDLPLYRGFAQQAQMFGWKVQPVLGIDRFFDHGDRVALGKSSIEVVHTPGHTPGSVCFELIADDETLFFSGDTLFYRSIGRTDLPGGNTKQLMTSIRERVYTRDLDAKVIPGHGPMTTIEEEADRNPFVRRSGE